MRKGAGVNDVSRQVDIVGYTRVFGLFACDGALEAGNINCRGTLHACRISLEFEHAIKKATCGLIC